MKAHVTWSFLGLFILTFSLTGIAQQVHVTPVVPPAASKPVPKKPAPLPAPPPGLAGEAAEASHPIHVNVNMVLVPVTVTDPMGRLVTGLSQENFRLFDNKDEQRIRSFSNEDAPVSVGIIFDLSGSMSDKIRRSRDALQQFLRTSNPQDEFFLIGFSDQPMVVSNFTSNIDQLENRIAFLQPHGRTALLDAIYLGLDLMRDAHQSRKALLIISDGGDNHSRYTEHEVMKILKEAYVQIYSIGIVDAPWARATPEEAAGPGLMSDIAESTGGREFTIDDLDELPDVATRIGIALRNEYVLGYVPQQLQHNGKWRKINVKLNSPPGLPPLTLSFRRGYYAPGG